MMVQEGKREGRGGEEEEDRGREREHCSSLLSKHLCTVKNVTLVAFLVIQLCALG